MGETGIPTKMGGGEWSRRNKRMAGGRLGSGLTISGVCRSEVGRIATPCEYPPALSLMALVGIAILLSFGVEGGLGQQTVPSGVGLSHIRINCGGLATNDSLGLWEEEAPLIVIGDSTSQVFPELNNSSPLASYREFGNNGGEYSVKVNTSAYYRVQLLFLFRTSEMMVQEKIVQVSIQGHEGESVPRWVGAPGFSPTMFDSRVLDLNFTLYVSEYVFFCDSANLSIALRPAEPTGIVLPRVSVIYIWELADDKSVLQLQSQMMGKDIMLMTWHRRNCGGNWIWNSEGNLWEGDSETPVENFTVSLTAVQSTVVQTNDSLEDTQHPWVPTEVWTTARISAPRTNIEYSVNLDQAQRYFLAIYVAPIPEQGVRVGSELSLNPISPGTGTGTSGRQIKYTVNDQLMILHPIPRVDMKFTLAIRLLGKNSDDRAWISGLEVIRVIPMKGLTSESEVQALREIVDSTKDFLEAADPCVPPSGNLVNITCGSTSDGIYTPTGLGGLNQASTSEKLIPQSISKLTHLETLNLSSSNFNGAVPGSDFWTSLSSLKIVDLSNNHLEGGIPTSFASLQNLTYLNLDRNNLSGDVPLEIKNKTNLSLSYALNPFLCEPLQNCKVHDPVLPVVPVPNNSSEEPPVQIKVGSSSNKTAMTIGLACGGAVIVVIIVVAAMVFRKNLCSRQPVVTPSLSRKLDTESRSTGTHSHSEESRIPDLPFTVTQYTPAQIKGALAAGTRLKMDDESTFFIAQLNNDAVIIKRITCRNESDISDFRKEVEVLSRIHHRNLLRFLGCCVRPGSEAIVFESTGNGTLYEALHGIVKKTNPLLWRERVQICVGIASALYYLHTQVTPAVVHRNISTSNIVLDKKSQAKLANFSFSRPVAEKTGTVVGTLTEVRGTTGYVDPEYEATGNVSTASDIFSLGVVLLEILTGRRAIVFSETEGRQIPLADWVQLLLKQGPIEKVLDPALHPSTPKGLGCGGNLQADLEAARAIADCGIRCCNIIGKQRPAIAAIDNELERIKKVVRLGTPSGQRYSDSYASSPGSTHQSRSSVSANPASQENVSQGRFSH